MLNEMDKHKQRICAKVGISSDDFDFIFNELILPAISVVEDEFYRDKIRGAKEIAEQFDYKDYPFIALALKLNVPIWTNDKDMIVYGLKSGKYLALDTQAVEELLKGKSLEEVRRDLKRRHL